MKFLTALATTVALVIASAAHAASDGLTTSLPPVKYDVPYTRAVTIWVAPLPVIEYFCRGSSHVACAFPLANECRIMLLQSVAEGKRFDTLIGDKAAVNVKINLALTLRHEFGHCNGWPSKHPDGRKADNDPAMPTWPAKVKVACVDADRMIVDCKIVKPWWPQPEPELKHDEVPKNISPGVRS